MLVLFSLFQQVEPNGLPPTRSQIELDALGRSHFLSVNGNLQWVIFHTGGWTICIHFCYVPATGQ